MVQDWRAFDCPARAKVKLILCAQEQMNGDLYGMPIFDSCNAVGMYTTIGDMYMPKS